MQDIITQRAASQGPLNIYPGYQTKVTNDFLH